MKEQN